MNSAFDENCAPMNALAQRHRRVPDWWCANETRRSTMPFVICHLFFKEEEEKEKDGRREIDLLSQSSRVKVMTEAPAHTHTGAHNCFDLMRTHF